jgi:16S rRNA (cytosine967-C5)-methyltransferase
VKFGHLAQRASGAASLTAVEIDARKAASLSDLTGKWERDEVRVVHQDAVQFADSWKGPRFDAVLADVPCSGTGTIRRHPDIKWKNFGDLLPRLVRAQRSILDAAARLVDHDGVILYVTCSLEADENEENVAWFLTHRKDFTLADLRLSAPSTLLPLIDENGFFRTWPPLHSMDGFFAALLKRS